MNSLDNFNKNFVSRELQIEINQAGFIIAISSNCYDILGYPKEQLLNAHISEYINFDIAPLVSIENFNISIRKSNGLLGYFDIQVSPFFIDDKIDGFYLSIIDISKYKELEERELMFFRMFENAKDIVCRYELLPEPRFTYLSHSVESILGYTVEEYIGDPNLVFNIVHPDDYEIQQSKINSKTDFSKLFELRYKHKNGHYVWLQDHVIPTFNEKGELIAVESITRNIQEKKDLLERFERLGYEDNLTGLYNKNYFLNEFDLLNNTYNIPVGIIVCDLDNLKYINDTLGHSFGDKLIQRTSDILRQIFSSEHIITRTGGDEFVIIVKNTFSSQLKILYSKLQTAIKVFNEKNVDFPIDISIGFSFSETSIGKMGETLDIADRNMYNQKKHKKQIKNSHGKPLG